MQLEVQRNMLVWMMMRFAHYHAVFSDHHHHHHLRFFSSHSLFMQATESALCTNDMAEIVAEKCGVEKKEGEDDGGPAPPSVSFSQFHHALSLCRTYVEQEGLNQTHVFSLKKIMEEAEKEHNKKFACMHRFLFYFLSLFPFLLFVLSVCHNLLLTSFFASSLPPLPPPPHHLLSCIIILFFSCFLSVIIITNLFGGD